MKLILPFFFFCCLIPFQLLSQNQLGEIAYAQWDVGEEKWSYIAFSKWKYDEEGREIEYSYDDIRFSDFLPTNNALTFSKYDSEGNLIETNTLNYGPHEWANTIRQYKYNADGEQIEELTTYTNSRNDDARVYRTEYETNQNQKQVREYQKNEQGVFILRSKTDSVFSANNCLIEHSNFNYHVNGSIQNGRKWINVYTDDCQWVQSDFLRWEVGADSLREESRYHYEYFNEGKTIVTTLLRFQPNVNEWETQYIGEVEYNEVGQIVRWFVESFYGNTIDSTLTLNSYTSKNELETYQQFEMRHTQNGKVFQRIQKDSFAYHYDGDDLITLKEKFSQFDPNPILHKTQTSYEYYCNGQLKAEIFGDDERFFSRRDYRYAKGVDCPLDQGDSAMLLFPNPTSGQFMIQANMLADGEVTILISTLLGQEIFSEKINSSSYQYQLDLSNVEQGTYIVTITNSENIISEKVIVFK